jgi:two-component system LytT family sensor kinase
MTTFISLKKNRELLFWSLHTLGWSSFALVQYVGGLFYGKSQFIIFVAATAGFVLSAPLRWACRALWRRGPAAVVIGGVTLSYITALAWRFVINLFYETFIEHGWVTNLFEYFGGTLSSWYLLVGWMGLYFGFKYYESMQLQREAALRAAALAQEAQLKMLRYQLNPHFLFNTLNAISTLILDNRNRVANSAVTGLSEFLRYTLDQDPMKKVTVAQEVEALNLYLDIEKMRFGSRLQIEVAIDDTALNMLVPSLVLQPLMENAIKYAVSPREEGGHIRVGGHVTGGTLQLEVSDNGPGLIDTTRLTNGRGVGIRNTRERLSVLYGEHGVVKIENTYPGLRVALSLPAERATEVEHRKTA